jgi:hypothetical protein
MKLITSGNPRECVSCHSFAKYQSEDEQELLCETCAISKLTNNQQELAITVLRLVEAGGTGVGNG